MFENENDNLYELLISKNINNKNIKINKYKTSYDWTICNDYIKIEIKDFGTINLKINYFPLNCQPFEMFYLKTLGNPYLWISIDENYPANNKIFIFNLNNIRKFLLDRFLEYLNKKEIYEIGLYEILLDIFNDNANLCDEVVSFY